MESIVKLFEEAVSNGEIYEINTSDHGYLKAPLKLVYALVECVDLEISTGSLHDEKFAYLEEDVDAQLFKECLPLKLARQLRRIPFCTVEEELYFSKAKNFHSKQDFDITLKID